MNVAQSHQRQRTEHQDTNSRTKVAAVQRNQKLKADDSDHGLF